MFELKRIDQQFHNIYDELSDCSKLMRRAVVVVCLKIMEVLMSNANSFS